MRYFVVSEWIIHYGRPWLICNDGTSTIINPHETDQYLPRHIFSEEQAKPFLLKSGYKVSEIEWVEGTIFGDKKAGGWKINYIPFTDREKGIQDDH